MALSDAIRRKFEMFNVFGEPLPFNPFPDLESPNVAIRDVYFFKGEQFVAKRTLVRTVTEYTEAQEAYPDCQMWMKIDAFSPWQYYHKGLKFNYFCMSNETTPEPKALSMMELTGAL